ncbi:Lrp/AsnC family transcriptional regulator [Nocardia arthritidis]|uniref:Lrp/AsnC family transcriptional regulator n=1 Tax=Nocardia arthritidis TaxID=228602 RepID=UPI00142DF680|nr:AsnC family transcriptional regulator [Nocardia arthritidis]
MDSDSLDELDRQLLHALQIDGRAPFSRIAEVLGVSDRTLARRYGRLRGAGVVRVTGVADSAGIGAAEWVVRIKVRANAVAALARALTARPDIAWVSVLSSGTEIACLFRVPGNGPAPLAELARHQQVSDISAQRVLRHLMRRRWHGRTSALDADRIAALRPADPDVAQPISLTELDHRLLAALAADGRAAYPDLARRTGWSESAVRRRLAELRRTGLVRFSVEIDPGVLGFAAPCVIWLTVAPNRLTAVGRSLSEDAEAAFIAATTGVHNLILIAVFHDSSDLYTYLAERIGAIDGIERVETALIATFAKRDAPTPPS